MRREKKSRPEVRGERKSNKKQYFGLPFLSVPLQICNGTDKNGIILAHIQHLMGGIFCVWCGKCAKYLAFDTFATSTMGVLRALALGNANAKCKGYLTFQVPKCIALGNAIAKYRIAL